MSNLQGPRIGAQKLRQPLNVDAQGGNQYCKPELLNRLGCQTLQSGGLRFVPAQGLRYLMNMSVLYMHETSLS